MAFETLILKALRARMDALVLSPVLPIDWPDVVFTSPELNGKKLPYLKSDFLWNRNVNRSLSNTSTTEHRGIFQVTVVYPANTGLNGITDIAGTIANWFERGSAIEVTGCRVQITGKPSLGGYSNDGLYERLPVSVMFYAFESG